VLGFTEQMFDYYFVIWIFSVDVGAFVGFDCVTPNYFGVEARNEKSRFLSILTAIPDIFLIYLRVADQGARFWE
jgi:hypothetical protein